MAYLKVPRLKKAGDGWLGLRPEAVKKYGINNDDYNNMLEQQNGTCAICGSVDTDRRLAIDHDHDTGKVRGLLCKKCNLAIGILGDNVETLRNAIEYLENHSVSSC